MSLLGVGLRTRRKPQVASGPFRLPNQFCCEKNVIVTTDDLAERGQAGHACYPAFLLGSLNQSLSPYINRFLSADTIVPGYTNPQNLNRYSYVLNNPLRFTDPTGHRPCGDGETVSCDGYLNKPAPKKPGSGCGGPGQKSCLGKNSDKKEKKDRNWFLDLIEDKNTPLALAIAQEFATGVQEVGLIMVAAGGVTANPGVGSAGAAIFVGGWTVGRVAGAAGSAVTTYQYNHNLNGTNGTDMYVSWGTTVAGLNPEWSAATSTINLVYTAVRTAGVEVPNIPWIFPRKE